MRLTAPDPHHVYITPMELVEMMQRWDNSDLVRLLQLALLWPDLRGIAPPEHGCETVLGVQVPAATLAPWEQALLDKYRRARAEASEHNAGGGAGASGSGGAAASAGASGGRESGGPGVSTGAKASSNAKTGGKNAMNGAKKMR